MDTAVDTKPCSGLCVSCADLRGQNRLESSSPHRDFNGKLPIILLIRSTPYWKGLIPSLRNHVIFSFECFALWVCGILRFSRDQSLVHSMFFALKGKRKEIARS